MFCKIKVLKIERQTRRLVSGGMPTVDRTEVMLAHSILRPVYTQPNSLDTSTLI